MGPSTNFDLPYPFTAAIVHNDSENLYSYTIFKGGYPFISGRVDYDILTRMLNFYKIPVEFIFHIY